MQLQLRTNTIQMPLIFGLPRSTKPTATFDLMSICEPHFAALDAKLIEAINTLLNSRSGDLARPLINVKEAAVKKEAGRLKGRRLLWTVYEYYKLDPKSAVLLKMIDLAKTKLHGDKLAEFLRSHVGQLHDSHRRKYR